MMKKVLLLIVFSISGLLIGFFIGNKNMFSSNNKKVNVIFDISKKIEVEKNNEIIVSSNFKDDKNMSIKISNIKNDIVKIKFYIKNNSKNNKALVSIKSKYDKNICSLKIKPNKLEVNTNESKLIELEINIKDVSNYDKEKLDLDIILSSSPL